MGPWNLKLAFLDFLVVFVFLGVFLYLLSGVHIFIVAESLFVLQSMWSGIGVSLSSSFHGLAIWVSGLFFFFKSQSFCVFASKVHHLVDDMQLKYAFGNQSTRPTFWLDSGPSMVSLLKSLWDNPQGLCLLHSGCFVRISWYYVYSPIAVFLVVYTIRLLMPLAR